MCTARATHVADASQQADVPPLSFDLSSDHEEDKQHDGRKRRHHVSMSTETHRSMGTGTSVDQAFMLRRREQGTSTDLPWHQRAAPTQHDQSTCTEEKILSKEHVGVEKVVVVVEEEEEEEEEMIQNSPWRRMVMAATAAAAERARLEPLPGTSTDMMTMTQGTATSPSSGGGIHYSNKKKSRRDSAAAAAAASAAVAAGTSLSYDSGVQERERDYSVIKDTCHALTEELRTFGAYVMAVDQQCRPTIEMFVQCLQVKFFFFFFFFFFFLIFFLGLYRHQIFIYMSNLTNL